MIRDMVRQYTKAFRENQKVRIDNYSLKDGLYIRVDINGSFDGISEKDYMIVEKGKANKIVPDLYQWFKIRDYYSVVLNDDTNKYVDLPARKIHSTNYLTAFFKKDKLPGLGGKDPITMETLEERLELYYDNFLDAETKLYEIFTSSNYIDSNLKRKKQKLVEKLFGSEIDYIRSERRAECIEKHKKYMLKNINGILTFLKEFTEKYNQYIKVFFKEDINIYQLENKLYLYPRIFNSNKYNCFINDEVLGLPSSNMSMNSKKPYLQLKTMRCEVATRLTADDTEVVRNFFNWMKVQPTRNIKLDYHYSFEGGEPYSNQDSYYDVHINTNGEIDDYDNIPFKLPRIEFVFENVLLLTQKSSSDSGKPTELIIPEDSVTEYPRLQKLVIEYFFNNKVFGFTQEQDPSIKPTEFTPVMKALYTGSRQAFYNFFNKGVTDTLRYMIDKLSMQLIEEQLKRTVRGNDVREMKRIAKAYNLRISFLKFFDLKGGKEMADKLASIMQSLKEKLRSNTTVVCENDEEFYFTVGQLAYYILSQSETQKKTFGLFEPFLIAKNSQQLKNKLNDVFAVYKHAISIDNIKFKNAYGMVMGYEPTAKMGDSMKNMLLAGIVANNIFYSKNKNEEGDMDNAEDDK